jgi:hypothetical protein
MPHNSRIRSGGLWVTGSTITQDELEQLDQAQYEAINGDDGGTWAPAAVITIGGSGLTVTGPARLSDVIAATWNAGGTATLTGSGTTMTFDNSALLVVTDDAEFRLNRSGDYLLRAYNAGTGQKLHLYGDMWVKSGAVLAVKSGGVLSTEAGSTIVAVGDAGFFAGVNFDAASTITQEAGSTMDLDGTITVDNFTLSGTNKVKLASRSITRACELTPTADPTEWLCDTVSGTGKWFALGNAAEILTQPIHIPHGATITGVSVYVQGDSGHVGLPATPPKFYIHETDVTDGTVTSYGPYTDASASTGAFQAVHAISSGVISVSVSRAASRFCLALSTESGANAKTLLGYLGARVTYTTTAYDED